jgi:hypothetical protein
LIDVSLERFQALQDSGDEDPDASDVSADEDDSDSDELASQNVLQVSVSSTLPPSRSECLSRPPCLASFVGGLFADAARTVSICPKSLAPCFRFISRRPPSLALSFPSPRPLLVLTALCSSFALSVAPSVPSPPLAAPMRGAIPTSRCSMVAAGGSPAQTFPATVNSIPDITCLIDSGLPVCFISTTAANRCSLSIDAAKTLDVASLAGPDFVVLGLATNVPFTIDYLRFLVQFYVVESPIVDVVLGQPFLHYAAASFVYHTDGDVDFVISEPGDPQRYLVATQPLPTGWEPPNAASSRPGLSGILGLGLPEDAAEPSHADRVLLDRLRPRPYRSRRSLADRISDHRLPPSYYVADANGEFGRVTIPHPPSTLATDQGWSGVQ